MDKTVVVPVEPTEEMIDAAFNEFDRRGFRISSSDVGKEDIAGVFKAMIAAAPAPAADANLRLAQGEWEAFEKWAKDACIRNVQAAWDAWQARAARTAPQDAQERNAIIEECAKVCEELAATVLHPTQVITDRCADAIRALKTAQPADKPEGKALVPMIPNRAMREVMESEDWQWEDLLAAAEAITEDQYAAISQTPEGNTEQQAGAVNCRDAEDGKAICSECAEGHYDKCLYVNPPAQPQQLTDDEIIDTVREVVELDGFDIADERQAALVEQVALSTVRALLAAGKERT